jgi:hypothetical protein
MINNDNLIKNILIFNTIQRGYAMGWKIEIHNSNKIILRKKKCFLTSDENNFENILDILLYPE